MRELILLRHAKSNWDDAALDDFDRPLAPRGRKAAPAMGRVMAQRGWMPDGVLVSAAIRARQTWELVAGELGQGAPHAATVKELYMAPAGRILRLINDVPEETRRLLVVGHNPGMGDLALRLSGPDSEVSAIAGMRGQFPTAALAHFVVEQLWAELEIGSARLTEFITPGDLSRA